MSAILNVGRLTKLVIFSLVLPVGGAIFADLLLETTPWITIVAAILVIPTASIIVTRASLAELDKIIQEVAPVESVDSEIDMRPLARASNNRTKVALDREW